MTQHNVMQTKLSMPGGSAPRTQLWRQVEEHFKALIRDGVLKPGAKLPPHEELFGMVGVGHSTLQRALQSLTRQGFLIRVRRQGTFIAQPTGKVDTHVAVMTRVLFDPAHTGFDLLAARALVDELSDAGRTFRFYHNQFKRSGRSSYDQSVDPALVREVEAGRVDGLLVTGAIPVGAFARCWSGRRCRWSNCRWRFRRRRTA